jgi:hypothetical protein
MIRGVFAALCLLAVVIAAACDAGQISTPLPGAVASPSAGTSSPAPIPLQALDHDGLAGAIAQIHAGMDSFRDVVTRVDIDPVRQTPPLVRECAYFAQCTVIGTLDGFSDPEGTVTLLHRDSTPDLPPDISPDQLRGPVALHVPRFGPIEFLGHVDLGPSGLVWQPGAVDARTGSAPNSLVVAVDGWLTMPMTSCGPAPMPLSPAVPAPFGCQPPASLTANQDGSGATVHVQTFAYLEFASDQQPAVNGLTPARRGLYLLRVVVYDAVNCPHCRGWLMVGRLDATPPFPPVATDLPPIRTAQELDLVLGRDRASLIGHAVFVDGIVKPGTPPVGCAGGAVCAFGTLDGSHERITITPYTATLLLPDTDFPTHGDLVFIVRPDSLEYVGFFAIAHGGVGSAIYSLDELPDANRGPITLLASGWLSDMAVTCPTVFEHEPPDTPFRSCPTDFLRPTADPATGSGTGGVVVQTGAYRQFAPDPASGDRGAGIPRLGTYVLRFVQDLPDHSASQKGWQVVARFAP